MTKMVNSNPIGLIGGNFCEVIQLKNHRYKVSPV